MPQSPPNPPRSGHPGKPPRREGDDDSNVDVTAKPVPHSYGQPAPMPDDGSPGTVVQPIASAQSADDDDPRETLEDLAGEPIREEGEDDPSA